MGTKLLIVLTIMTVVSCLTSGFPTTTKNYSPLISVDNQTDWKTIPVNEGREKSHRKKPGCKSYSLTQIKHMFSASFEGGRSRSRDGCNPQYMAFTWKEARKFPNLVTNVTASPGKVSYIHNLPFHAPKRPSVLLASRKECHTTESGCIECPAVRDLGRSRLPRYINEVTCDEGLCAWQEQLGICKSAVLNQQFYYRTGKCDPHTGYEQLIPYMQEIRVCCKCMIFP